MDENKIIHLKSYVLDKIKPSEDEIVNKTKIVNKFLEILKSKSYEYNAEVFLGGSFAKNTWLKGDHDVDIFVMFEKEDRISDILENILSDLGLSYTRIHGSRDYFKVLYNSLEFEIVPILKISKPEEAKNTTDLSPFHVKWFLEELQKNPSLSDEVRIVKSFMKACRVYGAESYIQGFSGYAVEILTVYYKNFENLIKNVYEKWRPKFVIDLKNYYNGDFKRIIKVLGKDKSRSPLIIIDPTYPKRNASAALSIETFSRFIYCVRRLVVDIDRYDADYLFDKYFTRRKLTIDDISKKYSNVSGKKIVIRVKSNIKNKDVRNSKIKSLEKYIRKHLISEGLYIISKHVEYQENENDEAFIFYLLYPEELSKYKIHRGPLIWLPDASKKFIEKWSKSIVDVDESGRLYTIIERENTSIKEFVKNLLEIKLKSDNKWVEYWAVEEI